MLKGRITGLVGVPSSFAGPFEVVVVADELTAVGHGLLPGDQPVQPARPVLGLDDHVEPRPTPPVAGVGHDDHLRRAGEGGRHPDDAGHLLLGRRHVGARRDRR